MATTMPTALPSTKWVDAPADLFDLDDDDELMDLRLEAREDIEVDEAREDINVFAEYCFTDGATGENIKQADVHREIQETLNDPDQLFNIVEISRDHGKTSQLIIRELFLLGHNHERRSKIICENDKNAIKRLKAIREHIEKNKKIHEVFPDLRPGKVWDKTQIQVDRKGIAPDSSIEACSISSAGTGGRADELVFDDPVGRRNTLGVPALRNKVREAYHSDWLQLLEPHGRISIACTGWTTDDLIYDLKQNQIYRVLRRPCTGYASPWPEKWSEKALRIKKELVGSTEYSRGFELVPLSGDVVVVLPEWIKYWEFAPDPDKLLIFTGYDLSTGEGKDFFSCVNVGLDVETGFFYILSAWHKKITFLAQVEAVIGETIAWNPDEIDIEATQYQVALPQFLQHQGTLGLIRSVKPSISKLLRLMGIQSLFESGRILWNPALDPRVIINPRERGDLVTELTQFPLAANDDMVDGMVHAVRRAMEYLLRHNSAGTINFCVSGILPNEDPIVVADAEATPLIKTAEPPKIVAPPRNSFLTGKTLSLEELADDFRIME